MYQADGTPRNQTRSPKYEKFPAKKQQHGDTDMKYSIGLDISCHSMECTLNFAPFNTMAWIED